MDGLEEEGAVVAVPVVIHANGMGGTRTPLLVVESEGLVDRNDDGPNIIFA